MLPRTADAVVVGGGINGASIAFHLALSGMRNIAVVEAVTAAHGASSRGAGIIRTFYANDGEARLAIASLAVFRNWRDEVGGTAGYNPCGFLWMVGPGDAEGVEAIVGRQRALGAVSEVLPADEIARLQPHLDVHGIGVAAYEPQGGFGMPALATASLHAAAQRLGARLHEGVHVEAINAEGGRVTGVSTTAGSIAAPVVVLAAGCWSAALAAGLGVTLPLAPTRMTTGTIRHAPLAPSPFAFIDTVTDTFFRPSEDAGVSHVSIRDDRHNTELPPGDGWVSETVAASASQDGIARLKVRVPHIRAEPLHAWVGPDGVTPDKRAVYGKVDGVEGLVLCVGGNYKGFKVAPAVGRSIAELITTGRSRIDLSAFSLQRFGDGRAASGPGSYSLADVA